MKGHGCNDALEVEWSGTADDDLTADGPRAIFTVAMFVLSNAAARRAARRSGGGVQLDARD